MEYKKKIVSNIISSEHVGAEKARAASRPNEIRYKNQTKWKQKPFDTHIHMEFQTQTDDRRQTEEANETKVHWLKNKQRKANEKDDAWINFIVERQMVCLLFWLAKKFRKYNNRNRRKIPNEQFMFSSLCMRMCARFHLILLASSMHISCVKCSKLNMQPKLLQIRKWFRHKIPLMLCVVVHSAFVEQCSLSCASFIVFEYYRLHIDRCNILSRINTPKWIEFAKPNCWIVVSILCSYLWHSKKKHPNQLIE